MSSIADLKQQTGRIIALDYGLRRIGIAISDPLRIMALPQECFYWLKTFEKTVEALAVMLKKYDPSLILIGNPLKLNGEAGTLIDDVYRFEASLKKTILCPFLLWDERLTSREADKLLKDASLNRKKRAGLKDSLSAVLILRSFLGY
ncbi:putative Holliday junction resolvase [Candidatus Clavichlamydia salmonicola]|uniref:Holliday junction resolvase RuvX n=1 Tax=Candidatus Clavichlamydia salmonicola TaxID=469812 RepID=UPI001891B12F|nr:Holliday junction resolvase RuvX [Candidatus Clavichlamydia salmonicola]MBF5050829.1 putative Holliday junction resolvase [Candidatus Clavichlamydia salmonicola]